MPSHKSAIKRVRQNKTRNERNTVVRSTTRTEIKKIREAIEKGEKDNATKALKSVTSSLASAASKGVIHKNNASRKISRLTTQVNKLA